uniref:Uncharacterized protein n=1 Tax=Anguilla anguilla TaxID=7936 RepID=A0A0E9QVP3_ANGAN
MCYFVSVISVEIL